VVIDQWRCAVGVCLVIIGYYLKAGREEELLSQQFGHAFQEHSSILAF
jgi:protein-S-isoprenylcysteine O-methyltransferase Ste14